MLAEAQNGLTGTDYEAERVKASVRGLSDDYHTLDGGLLEVEVKQSDIEEQVEITKSRLDEVELQVQRLFEQQRQVFGEQELLLDKQNKFFEEQEGMVEKQHNLNTNQHNLNKRVSEVEERLSKIEASQGQILLAPQHQENQVKLETNMQQPLPNSHERVDSDVGLAGQAGQIEHNNQNIETLATQIWRSIQKNCFSQYNVICWIAMIALFAIAIFSPIILLEGKDEINDTGPLISQPLNKVADLCKTMRSYVHLQRRVETKILNPPLVSQPNYETL